MSRPPALLTPSQRDFLRGDKEFESDQSAVNARYKIRQRLQNGLLDFALLGKHLDPRDREQIFRDIRTPAQRGDLSEVPDPMEDFHEDEIAGMVHAISFLYAGAHEAGLPFETLVETGLRQVDHPDVAGPFTVGQVNVSIEADPMLAVDDLVEAIEADRELTESEYLAVKRLLLDDLETFLEATEDVTVPRASSWEGAGSLPLGKSLVLWGRFMQNPYSRPTEEVEALVAEQVLEDFGARGTFTY